MRRPTALPSPLRTLLGGLALAALMLHCTPAPAHAQDEAAAQAAAREWLALVDRGAYAESWDAAAPLMRAAMPQPQWVATLQQVHAPLFPPTEVPVSDEDRTLIAAKYSTNLPNTPPGDYVVIQYRRQALSGADIVETLVMRRDDDAWRAAGYFMKPAQ